MVLVLVGVIFVLSVSVRGACLLALIKCYSSSVKVRLRMWQATANYHSNQRRGCELTTVND